MDKKAVVIVTQEQAQQRDRAYYWSLSPTQRVDILLTLVARYREGLGEAADRFERVCRVTKLS